MNRRICEDKINGFFPFSFVRHFFSPFFFFCSSFDAILPLGLAMKFEKIVAQIIVIYHEKSRSNLVDHHWKIANCFVFYQLRRRNRAKFK